MDLNDNFAERSILSDKLSAAVNTVVDPNTVAGLGFD
jgi:hypothetical protein